MPISAMLKGQSQQTGTKTTNKTGTGITQYPGEWLIVCQTISQSLDERQIYYNAAQKDRENNTNQTVVQDYPSLFHIYLLPAVNNESPNLPNVEITMLASIVSVTLSKYTSTD